MHYLSISLFLASILLCWPQVGLAKTNFIYPLGSWRITTHQGDDVGGGLYHMGIDAGSELDAGAPVYAVADGIVREAEERSQFGLVILIEHQLSNGSSVVSLYGHLDPTLIQVSPGQTVSAGDVIGVLGTTETNGGWVVHLHFGIHKAAYTGDWVYYGHVHDPVTAEDWYDPETFIPKHLVTDRWKPYASITDLTDGDIIGNSPTFSFQVGDIGSGVTKARLQILNTDGNTWSTLVQSTDTIGPISQTLDLSNYADGQIKLRFKIRDYSNNVRLTTIRLTKDPQRVDQPAYVTMSGADSPGTVRLWSYNHDELSSFAPFGDDWTHSGDLTTGDIDGDSESEIITAMGSKTTNVLNIFNQSGEQLGSFTPFTKQSGRVVAADLTGDGSAEIIVASGDHQVATVRTFAATGELLWEQQPFGDTITTGLDVTAGDTTGDGTSDIIVSTRPGTKTRIAILDNLGVIQDTFAPFKSGFTGGVNVTSGDVTGDGKDDIIVGTASNHIGTVRFLSHRGKKLGVTFRPFGDEFTGAVDVAMVDWQLDNITPDELLVSQAGHGQAWVKIYETTGGLAVLSEHLTEEASFTGGARVASWN